MDCAFEREDMICFFCAGLGGGGGGVEGEGDCWCGVLYWRDRRGMSFFFSGGFFLECINYQGWWGLQVCVCDDLLQLERDRGDLVVCQEGVKWLG